MIPWITNLNFWCFKSQGFVTHEDYETVLTFDNYKMIFSKDYGLFFVNDFAKKKVLINDLSHELLSQLSIRLEENNFISICHDEDYFGIGTKIGFLGEYKKWTITYSPKTREVSAHSKSNQTIQRHDNGHFFWQEKSTNTRNIIEAVDKVDLMLKIF